MPSKVARCWGLLVDLVWIRGLSCAKRLSTARTQVNIQALSAFGELLPVYFSDGCFSHLKSFLPAAWSQPRHNAYAREIFRVEDRDGGGALRKISARCGVHRLAPAPLPTKHKTDDGASPRAGRARLTAVSTARVSQ